MSDATESGWLVEMVEVASAINLLSVGELP